MVDLQRRRECFRVEHAHGDCAEEEEEEGLSDEEMNEIVTLQICDMIHCFIFHSSKEPHLVDHSTTTTPHHTQPSSSNLLQVTERNVVETQKFTLSMRPDPERDGSGDADGRRGDGDTFQYDGDSFGVLLNYKVHSVYISTV